MDVKLMDLHIIRISNVWDERPVEGIVPLNSAWYTTEKELDRYERKLLEGVVETIPMGYSETEYMPLDYGLPNPRLFIGHDSIQLQVNLGRKDWGREKYHPGLIERYKYITKAEYGAMIDLRVGEKVYFHPSVTEEENLLEKGDEYSLYMASVDQLICGVYLEPEYLESPQLIGHWLHIRPQGGFILIDPIMDERTESEGIVFRQEAEQVMLEGIVNHTRPGSPFKKGQHIYYLEDSDWAFNIEGTKYFAMTEDQIIGS